MEAHVVTLLAPDRPLPESVEFAEWFLPTKFPADTHTRLYSDDKQAKTYEHLLLRLCFASVLPTQIEELAKQCSAMGNSQSVPWVGSNAFPLPFRIECICNARGPPPRQRTPRNNIRALARHPLYNCKQTPRLSRCVSIDEPFCAGGWCGVQRA